MNTNDWRKEVLSGANVAQFQIYCSESVSCSLLLAAKGDNLVFLSPSDPGGRIFDGLKTIKRVFLLFHNNFIFIHLCHLVCTCACVWEGGSISALAFLQIIFFIFLSSEYPLRIFFKLTHTMTDKALSHE